MSEPQDEENIQREQLLLAAMQFAVRFARRNRVSLDRLTQAARSMYFRQLRQEGMSIDEICEVMDIGPRTAYRISKALKSEIGQMERAHTVPTRIEFLLWTISLTRARLHQTLDDLEPSRIDEALETLISEGRIDVSQERTPSFSLSHQVDRRVRPQWFHRIGAVNSLLDNVYQTIRRRFDPDTSDDAFSRTLTFRVRPEDEHELQELYEHVWKTCAELDARATESRSEDARPIRLSFLWSALEKKD